ncbi:hypothetical protein D3C71_1861510 [compost metagenome]
MQAGDGGHDRKPQPEALGRLAAAAAAEEALVDQAAILRRDAGAVVDHIDARCAVVVHRAQHDPAPRRGEVQRVGKQVGQRFEQQFAVAPQRAHLRIDLQ